MVLIIMMDVELRVVWTFEHVLVKVHENSYGVDHIYENVAVEFVNELWNVRCDPSVVLCTCLKVYMSSVISICLEGDWLRKSIDASITLATAAGFTS
jgi:hypothetical protein